MSPHDARAKAVIDRVKSELTPIWLGNRQRVVLEDAITAELLAVERKTWVKAAKAFDKKFFATDKRLDNTRDYRVDEFYKWCRAKGQEVK